MEISLYLLLAILLLLTAYVVFRRIVRRDYLQKGHLTKASSFLQLMIFAGLISFPYLYNPPEWPWFWRLGEPLYSKYKVIGFILILMGFIIAFGTMFWFGIRRAIGFEVAEIVRRGPYRLSRNPQILGGYLLFIGVAVQYPSWYSLGWIILYGLIGHMMISTEEEHLREQYGETYERYCEEVPRYIVKLGRHKRVPN